MTHAELLERMNGRRISRIDQPEQSAAFELLEPENQLRLANFGLAIPLPHARRARTNPISKSSAPSAPQGAKPAKPMISPAGFSVRTANPVRLRPKVKNLRMKSSAASPAIGAPENAKRITSLSPKIRSRRIDISSSNAARKSGAASSR